MYSHRNSNSGAVHANGGTVVLLLAVVVVAFIFVRMNRSEAPEAVPADEGQGVSAAGPASGSGGISKPAPASNPLERRLRPPAGVRRTEGIGVILLVDTSGSMAEEVADAAGRTGPKIEIARRSALNMLRQCDVFVKANPDRVVRVGVSEFSHRDDGDSCRVVIPVGPLDIAAATYAVQAMTPRGNTPIGDAIISAKKSLDAAGLTRLHILVVTDGENNLGYDPADVVNAVSLLPAENRPAIYFIAFDIAAERFSKVRDAGAMVFAAGNEKELQQNLDYVLTGKILAEQPVVPGAKK